MTGAVSVIAEGGILHFEDHEDIEKALVYILEQSPNEDWAILDIKYGGDIQSSTEEIRVKYRK